MGETIIINPLTRINGCMEVEVEVEQNIIIDAKSKGMLFRGFEKMLKGRSPLDAIYFTERICGICSSAHAVASAYSLEDILKITPNENDKMLRDYIHGCDIIQNHIRHFYQFSLPDFVRGPKLVPFLGPDVASYRLPEQLNKSLSNHFIEALRYSKLAHEMLAVLGAKAPHNHGVFVGGITVNIDASKLVKIKSILTEIKAFVDDKMIPDAHIIADYYPEYFDMGTAYENFMTFGLFNHYTDKELFYVGPNVMVNGQKEEFNPDKITENIHGSWYEAEKEEKSPIELTVEENVAKNSGYSWIKAPRYDGYPMEVGPLVRMWFSNNYRRGFSTMDRILARVLEVKKIIEVLEGFLERIQLNRTEQSKYIFQGDKMGMGLTDTSRGALGHWISVKNNEIYNYEVITPSAWNLSSEDSKGFKGVLEKALIGVYIKDIKNPVEIGIIARSFDPCISCATHVISDTHEPITMRIL